MSAEARCKEVLLCGDVPPMGSSPSPQPQQPLWCARGHQSIAKDGTQVYFPLPGDKIHVTKATGQFQAWEFCLMPLAWPWLWRMKLHVAVRDSRWHCFKEPSGGASLPQQGRAEVCCLFQPETHLCAKCFLLNGKKSSTQPEPCNIPLFCLHSKNLGWEWQSFSISMSLMVKNLAKDVQKFTKSWAIGFSLPSELSCLNSDHILRRNL